MRTAGCEGKQTAFILSVSCYIIKSKLTILQRLQERARSIIDKARLTYDWSHDLLTVELLTNFGRSIITYKIINRQCPETFEMNIITGSITLATEQRIAGT